MCLNALLYKKEVKTLPETMTVYKVVRKTGDKYYPLFNRTKKSFKNGINKANIDQSIGTIRDASKGMLNAYYKAGFHFYLDKYDAEEFFKDCGRREIIITCTVKREDITAIGKQHLRDTGYTIVASKAFFNLPKEEKEKLCA